MRSELTPLHGLVEIVSCLDPRKLLVEQPGRNARVLLYPVFHLLLGVTVARENARHQRRYSNHRPDPAAEAFHGYKQIAPELARDFTRDDAQVVLGRSVRKKTMRDGI